ncbi:MAG: Lrp/AsnC family transcriptional regulator [Euryarchaeota archaeon]|nr:Lrp/AsnC family transcriptional regulator [Euryarchaeota archaeon]
MDDLDRSILRILSSDAQTNFKTIAEKCRTTVGTVHNRIKRLKEDGIIKRMIPELDAKKLGYGITAIIHFQIQGAHLQEVEQDLGRDPHVCSIYDVTGEYDAMMVAKFKDIEDLNGFVKRALTNRFITRTSTHLVLNVVKESFHPRIT